MCTRPMKGWAKTGGGFTFNVNNGWKDRPLTIPCNKCIECKGVQRFGKAIRVVHTLEMEPGHRGCFITLTYDDEHLPKSQLLELEKLQLFMKKLRHKTQNRLQYLAAGEYGGKTGRPHYHICLVGYEPDDVIKRETREYEDPHFDPVIEDTWRLGRTHVGTLTASSAMYTAKYVQKDAESSDVSVYGSPSRCRERETPEFACHSIRPGLGRTFFEKYWRDIYEDDFDSVIFNGVRVKPPRYYDKLLSEQNPQLWKRIRKKRQQAQTEEASYRELIARETTKIRNARMFKKEKF